MSLRALILIAVLLLSGCQTTLPEGSRIPLPGDTIADGSTERRALNARIYDRVVRRVQDRFYDRTFNGVDFRGEAAARREAVIGQPTEQTFYRSLNDLLDLLDDGHTGAERPRRMLYGRVRVATSASFGIETVADLEARDGVTRHYVHHVRPDGPAAGLGVQRGWWVQSIGGESLSASARYTPGEAYAVGFVDRHGEAHTRTIRYTTLPDELVSMIRRPDGVAVITLWKFQRGTARTLESLLAELQADPPKAVVVDLRFSPGGNAAEMPGLLGGFFTEPVRYGRLRIGVIDRVVSSVMGTATPERLEPSPRAWTGPLAVLQSARTASAAELFAAAVQECRRGPVVGETSDGVVVLALGWPLPDGGIVRVGANEFLTGGGARLEKIGVAPDIEVVRTSESLQTAEDLMLDAAAAAALGAPSGGRCVRRDPPSGPASEARSAT